MQVPKLKTHQNLPCHLYPLFAPASVIIYSVRIKSSRGDFIDGCAMVIIRLRSKDILSLELLFLIYTM